MAELHSVIEPRERAILVGAPPRSLPLAVAEDHLDELARLADTAGVEVVDRLLQRIDRPHPKFYIGEGKVEELKARIAAHGATLLLFDEDLSPAQGKHLEDATGTRVMDRTELILDIFATRARTAEAQLQVELAQLQYLRTRLTRMWAHLSRIRGGVGMRGPGETQLETDRRLIDRRIARLRRELVRVAQQRATQRKARRGLFRAALVGYTNAGKSSILRGLAGDPSIFVEDRLFATLDATTRAVELGPGARILLTDTVGFIRKLPPHLVASFRSTLDEAREADLLLHVLDVSDPTWEEQKEVVDQVLADLGLDERPRLLVANKIDRLDPQTLAQWKHRARSFAHPAVFVSARQPGGLEPLREALHEAWARQRPEREGVVPLARGDLLAELYRVGEVLDRRDEDGMVRVRVRLPAAEQGRLERHGVRWTDSE